MHELASQILTHLKAVARFRRYALLFAWFAAVGGWIFVYLMPSRYEVTARVYMDTQSVLRPLLQGLAVQPNVDLMVTMMSRTVISRPNIEKVILMSGMDGKPQTTEDRERLISRLTKELEIRSAGRENLYSISYSDADPRQAQLVVQSLLTLFVEGTMGDKRKDSDSALRFIDEQLKSYSEKLIAAENAITEFKRRNLGLMPGDRRDYYARLVEAKGALEQAELGLKEAENARAVLKRQVAGEYENPSLLDAQQGTSESATPEIDARIQALELKLDGLRLTYTEQHPDIVSIRRIIAQLNEQRKAEAKLTARKPSLSGARMQDAMYQQLTVSLATAEANVASMQARVTEYTKRYNELRAVANAVPQVEAEFTQLTRDYETTKASHQSLLTRRETATISGDMEANPDVMGFRVIDPPQVPLSPKSPNRPFLASIVLLVALGGGLGLAIVISQIRPTINEERTLRELSGLPVLGTVAMALTDAQRARRRRGLVASVFSFVSLLSAYIAMMAVFVLAVARG
ncbi:MAG: XrtA system polysaccharide chain length determinant [Burkholderiales bacterium]